MVKYFDKNTPPIYFKEITQPTPSDKAKKGKLLEEIKKEVKPGTKPSEIKKRMKDIDLKESMGRTQSQLLYNFACELCEQYRRQEHQNFHKLNGLGLDPNKLYRICDTCIDSGRANIVKERNDDYDPID